MMNRDPTNKSPKKKRSVLRRSTDCVRGIIALLFLASSVFIAGLFVGLLVLLLGLAAALCIAVIIVGSAVSFVIALPGILIGPNSGRIIAESIAESRETGSLKKNTPN